MNNQKQAFPVTIALFSDLHLEMAENPEVIVAPEANIIVLAGDIHRGMALIDYAAAVSKKNNTPVVVIAGNHEYYGYNMPALLLQLREQAKKHANVYFLENNDVIIHGIRFLGCTLWSDFTLFQNANHATSPLPPSEYRQYADSRVNDFFKITCNSKPFTGDTIIGLHHNSRQWLEGQLNQPFKGKTIVVTHFAPHPDCLADKWKKHPEGMVTIQHPAKNAYRNSS